jgi:hypothetical protein
MKTVPAKEREERQRQQKEKRRQARREKILLAARNGVEMVRMRCASEPWISDARKLADDPNTPQSLADVIRDALAQPLSQSEADLRRNAEMREPILIPASSVPDIDLRLERFRKAYKEIFGKEPPLQPYLMQYSIFCGLENRTYRVYEDRADRLNLPPAHNGPIRANANNLTAWAKFSRHSRQQRPHSATIGSDE